MGNYVEKLLYKNPLTHTFIQRHNSTFSDIHSGKKRRGQGIIWSKSHWSRQWISSSKKDRPKQGKKLKIYLNSRDVRWDSHTSSTDIIWSMYRLGEEPMVTCTKQKERMGELIDLYGFQNSSGRAMNWYDNLCYVIFHPTFSLFSDTREYALKQIEGTGLSMSACR